MASSIVNRLNVVLQKFEQIIWHYIHGGMPPSAFCTAEASYFDQKYKPVRGKLFDLESLKDGFLYAEPTARRTIERRLKRKFGSLHFVWKPYVAKNNILSCLKCGHNYLANHLCTNCYKTVKQETTKLQEEIQKELGLEPVEKEVIVLYKGEQKDNFWKNQKIIEVPRERPSWFSSNLMQSTTDKEGKNTDAMKSIEGKISKL